MKFPLLPFLMALSLSAPLSAQSPLTFASGSWFDPQRNGEGFVVQILPDGRAVVTWFTYPPAGEDAVQTWLIGSGSVAGNRIEISAMVRPVGATFGPEFDPDDVVREPWGSLDIEFEDCNTAHAQWSGPPGYGDGGMDLVRLSSLDDVTCDPDAPPESNRIVSGRSGPWYDPAHDGEGWMVETLADGRAVVYWFTYDDAGRQAWMIGEGRLEGRTLLVDYMLRPLGTHFGADFVAADIALPNWGRFGMLFEDCMEGVTHYESVDPAFGAGTLAPVHLAQLASTHCADPPPEPPLAGGSWRMAAPLPGAVSEAASITLDGYVYSAGGFGNAFGLLRFDPRSGSHVSMPDMPDERHHPMIATDGRYLYVAGGYVSRFSEVAGNNLWRYDPDAAEWAELPNLPQARAAGAAVYLNGRIWIVGGLGIGATLQAYDVASGTWSQHLGSPTGVLDHMQAVVFENEIWWLGGRDPQTSWGVQIWNPVSERWRVGPHMLFARSGLAARVVRGQIMVAGGERIDVQPAQLVPSMEVFAPGAAGWVQGPQLPIGVHGVTGASADGEFILVGGSNIAGNTSSNTATQVYTPAE